MKSLEQFAILSDSNSSSARATERCHLDDAYRDRAINVLGDLSEVVTSSIVPNLENYQSRWHPSGFMVFALGKHELGFLRLHVWPDFPRQAAPKGDTIHDHAWFIASLALATYRDAMYEVSASTIVPTEEVIPTDLLRVYSALYHPDGSQTVRTDGSCVKATVAKRRVVPAGASHTIEPGIFHRPEIPDEDFAATLVLSSFRTKPDGPYFLANDDVGTSYNVRPNATLEQINSVKAALLMGEVAGS